MVCACSQPSIPDHSVFGAVYPRLVPIHRPRRGPPRRQLGPLQHQRSGLIRIPCLSYQVGHSFVLRAAGRTGIFDGQEYSKEVTACCHAAGVTCEGTDADAMAFGCLQKY